MLEPAASYPEHTNAKSRCCGEAKDRVLLDWFGTSWYAEILKERVLLDRFGTSWYIEILFGRASAVLKPWASPCSPRYFGRTPGLTH